MKRVAAAGLVIVLSTSILSCRSSTEPPPRPSEGAARPSLDATAAVVGTWTISSPKRDDPTSLTLHPDGTFELGSSAAARAVLEADSTSQPVPDPPEERRLSTWRIGEDAVLHFRMDPDGFGTYVATYRHSLSGDRLSLTFLKGEHRDLPKREGLSWVTGRTGRVALLRK